MSYRLSSELLELNWDQAHRLELHESKDPIQYKLKFIYSEKATKFCEIFTLLLTVCIVVKSKVKILQNFVAFSENLNFTNVYIKLPIWYCNGSFFFWIESVGLGLILDSNLIWNLRFGIWSRLWFDVSTYYFLIYFSESLKKACYKVPNILYLLKNYSSMYFILLL